MDMPITDDSRRIVAILDEMNVAVFTIPPKSSTAETWANNSARRLAISLGQPVHPRLFQGDLAAEVIALLTGGAQPEAQDWKAFQHALRSGASFARFEMGFPQGQHHLVTYNRSSDGGAALFMTDITELTQYRLQRHRMDKLASLGRLAANYAHDFNNYLAVINRQLELMSMNPALTPDLGRLLEQARATTHSAAGRSQELLTFSKPQQSAQKWVRAREIVGRLRASTAFMQSEALSLQFETRTPLAVHCDAVFLHSALLNLLINACDACAGKGEVAVRASEAGAEEVARWHPDAQAHEMWLKFSVSDTGHGITEADRERIFDAFYTTKSADGGSGLGLNIVENFVKANNGLAFVEATSAQGTTISMLLPASLPESVRNPPEVADVPPPDGFRVLIVEDEYHLAESTRNLLELRGFRVDLARSLEEALPLVMQPDASYDAVLSDVVLPDGNGIELCRRSKAIAPARAFLLISGNIPESLSGVLAECGADDVLIKPTPISELCHALLGAAARQGAGPA